MVSCLRCLHDETEHRNDIITSTVNDRERKYDRMCEHRNCRCKNLVLRTVVE